MKITGRPGLDKECKITEATAEAVALAKTLGSKARVERDGSITADMKIRYKFSELLNPKPAPKPSTEVVWTDADEARLTEARQRLTADPKAPFTFEDVADLEARKHHLTAPVSPAPSEAQVRNAEWVLSDAYDDE